MRWIALVAAALLLACGREWDRPRCNSASDCNAGLSCDRPDPGELGVCYQPLRIDSPSAGTLVGPNGTTVSVTLTFGSATPTAPSTLTLVVDGADGPALALQGQNALQATYSGSYLPGSGVEKDVSLVAVAQRGTPSEVASPPAGIIVDTEPPRISNLSFTCSSSPCLRDGVLTVRATVADANLDTSAQGVIGDVTFGKPATPITIALSGVAGEFQGTLDLKGVPFPFLQREGTATVRARDLAQNSTTSGASSPLTVTRIRWSIAVESSAPPSLTGPAVASDGTLYLGASNGKVYVVRPQVGTVSSWAPDEANPSAIASAPALGATALWVTAGSKVYALNTSNGSILNGTGCDTGGSSLATPALIPGVSPSVKETAYVGSKVSQDGFYFAARSDLCQGSSLYASQPFVAAAVIDSSGNAYAVSGTLLRSLKLVNPFGNTWTIKDNWTSPPTVGAVEVPLAVDDGPSIWTAASDGSLKSTDSVGGNGMSISVGASPSGLVIDANKNVIVGDSSGKLHQISPSGTATWTSPPDLGVATLPAVVLKGGDAAYLVPLVSGELGAVTASGSVLWKGQVAAAGKSLNEGNILKLPGDAFSTAVFGAADGTVYGVLVDGDLDTAAPWPKSHHDTRNTGNLASPLP